jgi:thiamine phosphate synthase YjbQ (UPF0047 family)
MHDTRKVVPTLRVRFARPGRRSVPAPAPHSMREVVPMTSVEIPASVAAALPTLAVFDITNEISREVRKGAHSSGLAYITPGAPSSLVRVTERESGFFCDLEDMLSRLVPLEAEGRERLIVALLGTRTEQVPFQDGRLCLGQWQRVLLFGFNGDARADYTLTLVG